jgi:glycosyltransferase involved in cell wall biosynthesis
MEKGKDKGYDVFIEVAQRLAGSHPEIRFHVVGGFSPAEISIDGLDDKIFFYGPRAGKWFDDFYRDKDIILSPNVPFMLRKGTFDGFPTASCTEAGVRKVAMFCTDELQLNSAFVDGQDLVIIPHDAGKIAAVIEQHCADPGRLRSIALNGALKIRNVYGYDSQILPRIRILEQELERTPASRQPGTKEKLDATPN